MSAFVDATLLRFAKDTFVQDLVTNGVGLSALLNATLALADVELESIAFGSVLGRSYKVPTFESVRSRGVDERIIPDVQRVSRTRTIPRFGRLDWVDVSLSVQLAAKTHAVVAPLQSLSAQPLETKLGGVTSLADLQTKLAALYAPSVVSELLAKLRITTFEDFDRQKHLLFQLVGAAPPAYDPNDPANARTFTVNVCVKIADGFDVSDSLQSAKLCRDILEYESTTQPPSGTNVKTPYAFITVFSDAVVTDKSLPGMTAAQAKAAVQALFNAENMFAYFIT